MARPTITLGDELHRALKEAAARRGVSIRRLIEESLDFYGIKIRESAARLVEEARRRSGRAEAEAVPLAVRETRADRGE